MVNKPKESLRIVRNHWALDVQLSEDLGRKRVDNPSQNFSLVNKIPLNLINKEKSCKLGVKSKRKKVGWDDSYLKKTLILLVVCPDQKRKVLQLQKKKLI